MLTMTEPKADWKPDAIPVQDPDAPLFGEIEESTEAEESAEAKREQRLTDRIRKRNVQPSDLQRVALRRWDARHDVTTDLSLAIDGNDEDRERYVAERLRQGMQGRSRFLEEAQWMAFRFLKPDEGDRDYWGMALVQMVADKLDARGLLKQAYSYVQNAEGKRR
jgi:hypothetical protein